jgi:hypothetical protein
MPIEFSGAPFPFRIVLITAVDDRPAFFGFVAANVVGVTNVSAITIARRVDSRLRFMETPDLRGSF